MQGNMSKDIYIHRRGRDSNSDWFAPIAHTPSPVYIMLPVTVVQVRGPGAQQCSEESEKPALGTGGMYYGQNCLTEGLVRGEGGETGQR